MSHEFGSYFSNTFLGSLISSRSHNDRYTSQPRFFRMPLDFNRKIDWTTITGQEREIYLTTPELKLVIDRLSLMFSNGIWKHLDKNGDPIENSEFIKLLENPNVQQSRNEFLFQWFVQRSIYANVYVRQLLGTSLQEVPTSLWNLPPSRMAIKRTGKIWNATELDEVISGYILKLDREGKQNETFDTEEIIQFSMPDVDDPLIGSSPLEALRMPISNIRAAYGYLNLILAKRGGLGIWSTVSKDNIGSIQLTPDEELKMSKQLTETYGIGDGQASVGLSNKEMKFTPATFPTKDLLLLEQLDANMKRIIDTLGANDNMFSREKGGTFNNVQAGEKIAYQDTIIPVAKDVANGFAKRWLILDKGEKLELTYDHLPIMQEDEQRKSIIIERKAKAAAILAGLEGFDNDQIAEIVGFDLD